MGNTYSAIIWWANNRDYFTLFHSRLFLMMGYFTAYFYCEAKFMGFGLLFLLIYSLFAFSEIPLFAVRFRDIRFSWPNKSSIKTPISIRFGSPAKLTWCPADQSEIALLSPCRNLRSASAAASRARPPACCRTWFFESGAPAGHRRCAVSSWSLSFVWCFAQKISFPPSAGKSFEQSTKLHSYGRF